MLQNLLLILLSALTLQGQPSDSNLTIGGQTIDSLMAQMTTKEKATLLVGNGWSSMFMGIGMARPNSRHAVPGAAGETRAIKRLGIPSIILSDGPAGPRVCAHSYLFPAAMNLAATADTALVEEVGYAMGLEAKRLGIHVLLAPGMNLTTNPLCGRNYEYFSPDPDTSAMMARAVIRGMQAAGVGATAKHFAMNNVEQNRMKYNFVVDSLVARTLYLENFRQTLVCEHAPWCVMSAYNKVNGTYVQLSPFLLDTILRKEWGYEGVVMTDWMFYDDIADRVNAGNDLIMPGMSDYIGRITRAVKSGKISEERLNEAARRVLTLVARSLQGAEMPTPAAGDILSLIRRAGAASCRWIMRPETISAKIQADRQMPTIALYGTAAYHTIAGGTGSGFVRCDSIIDIATGLHEAGFTIMDDHKKLYREWLKVRRNFEKVGGMSVVSRHMGRPAAKFLPVSHSLIEQDAQRTDFALLVIGRLTGEGHDIREANQTLSKTEFEQLAKISASFHEQGKQVLVLLNTPPYFETATWEHLADGIAHIGYPGQEAGRSVSYFLLSTILPR